MVLHSPKKPPSRREISRLWLSVSMHVVMMLNFVVMGAGRRYGAE